MSCSSYAIRRASRPSSWPPPRESFFGRVSADEKGIYSPTVVMYYHLLLYRLHATIASISREVHNWHAVFVPSLPHRSPGKEPHFVAL